MAADQNTPTDTTPPKHSEVPTDQKGSIEHPNYHAWQTRTGNVPIFVNDTKGNEFIKAQHRTGTFWEMIHDGLLKFNASKNREDITYGKHVTYVTGAHDMTVTGDSSIRTGKNRRTTTGGNSEDTVKGDSLISAKSLNLNAAEQVDVAAQSFTSKVKTGMLMQVTDGSATFSSAGPAVVSSKEGSVGLVAEAGAVGIAAAQKVSMLGNEAVHIKGGGGEIVFKDGKVYINCGLYESPKQVYVPREDGQTVEET